MFEIGGSAILIELKFCRNPDGPSVDEIQAYEADLKKLIRLQQIVAHRSSNRDKVFGVFAFFNKTDNNRQLFDNLLHGYSNAENLKAIYATGKVDFTGVNPNRLGSGYLVSDEGLC